MKKLSMLTVLVTLAAAGCAPPPANIAPTAPPPTVTPLAQGSDKINAVDSIRRFQKLAGLPDSLPTFSDNTRMANSPNGDFEVMLYKDTEGRLYSVSPVTFQVVEMDARALLPSYKELSKVVPDNELATRAEKLAAAAMPNFETLSADMSYKAGNRGENFFFTWQNKPDSSLVPPFIQVAYHRSGQLFAYYNTLLLK